MQTKHLLGFAFALGFLFIALLNSLFIVNQTEQALVLQFGQARKVVRDPGLNVKMPFIQNVVYFDKRLLDFNAEPKEVIDSDKKPIVIDVFLRYRITDPLKYYQSVQNERGIRARLNDIMESSLRKVVGSHPYTKLLSPERGVIMNTILRDVNSQATGRMNAVPGETSAAAKLAAEQGGFGIEVLDVRIKRADLPEKVSEPIYNRMRSERERIAKEFRAQGEEAAQRLRSIADRERTEITSEARRKAEVIRGEADAVATKIYADAFNRDKDFYDFYRTLQAYRQVLRGDDTTMVLSPDSEFLKYLQHVEQ